MFRSLTAFAGRVVESVQGFIGSIGNAVRNALFPEAQPPVIIQPFQDDIQPEVVVPQQAYQGFDQIYARVQELSEEVGLNYNQPIEVTFTSAATGTKFIVVYENGLKGVYL